MNKAFEKILERLEELKSNNPFVYGKTDKSREAETSRQTLNYAKEIVQEVAEEYNNGCIHCNNGSFTGLELAQIAIGLMKLKEYQEIGTVEEFRAAVEKQKEMIAYCDENDCSDCPYHSGSQKENRCMNDFIADEIVKGGEVSA